MTDVMPADLDSEDAKLVTLARGARARVGAAEGAAVRDETGRTYSAADVNLPALTLTSVELVIASAVSAGARGIECLVVLRDNAALSDTERRLVDDLGGSQVLIGNPNGSVCRWHSA